MTDVAALGLRVSSDELPKAVDRLQDFVGAAKQAESANDNLTKTFHRARDAKGRFVSEAGKAAGATERVGEAARSTQGSFMRMISDVQNVAGSFKKMAMMFGGGFASALGLNVLGTVADAWSDMQSRVGAAVRDMDAAPALMQRMVDVANASYSPLGQTVETYSRNVAVLGELGKSANEAADFTESLNHMLVLTATRGERAASVQNALSKAMAVGKLQADGLETILANGGAVAEALAKELGTTVNGLRAMASEGKITGQVIADAIIKPLDDVRSRAAEMPATIGDAFVRMGTNVGAFVGTLDQATGASSAVAGAIISVADGVRSMSQNLGGVAQAATVAGMALALAFGPAVLGAITASFVMMGTAAIASINGITAAMARNPIGALAIALLTAVSAAYVFRDAINNALGIDVVGVIKKVANTIIGSFVAAYEDIKFVWNQFPNIIGAAVIGAANLVINAVNEMVNGAKMALNDLISMINIIPGIDIGGLDTSSKMIPEISNPYADKLGAAVGDRNAAVNAAMTRDYIGEIGAAFDTASQSAANMNVAVAGTGSALGGAGGAAEKAANSYQKIVDGARQFIEAQKLEASTIGMTAEAAAKLKYEQDMLNKAANDNISLTSAQRSELSGLASQMAATEANTSRMKDAFDFAKGAAKGFFSDFTNGIKNGEGFFKSFVNASMNLLDKLISKLGDELVDALFSISSAGSSGKSGGGVFGSLISGIFSIFSAKGNAFTEGGVKAFAKGGAFTNQIVNTPTMFKFAKGTGLMGEAGPEAIMPLSRDGSGRLGVAVHGQAAANQNSSVHVTSDVRVSIDVNGTLKAFVEKTSQKQVRAAAPAIVSAAKQQAVPAMAEYQQNQAGAEWR